MRRLTFILFTLIISGTGSLQACDICGCGTGGNYMGILPRFQKNLLGLRLQYRNFLHPATELNTNGTSRVLEDRMYGTEAWMRWYPSSRIQVFAHVPYNYHQRIETGRTTEISGIGDIRLTGNYTLFNTGDSLTSEWKNLLLLGGGVKLPTGKYQQRDETKSMLPASFQIGTGAYSFILNAIHTLRYKNWGLNTALEYNFNGENELSYNYGNRSSAAFSLFYWTETSRMAFLPNAGISFEHVEKDYQYDVVKPYTGGTVSLLNLGLDLYIGKLYVNTFLQIPVSQNIPSAQPAGQTRMGIGIAYFLGRRSKMSQRETMD